MSSPDSIATSVGDDDRQIVELVALFRKLAIRPVRVTVARPKVAVAKNRLEPLPTELLLKIFAYITHPADELLTGITPNLRRGEACRSRTALMSLAVSRHVFAIAKASYFSERDFWFRLVQTRTRSVATRQDKFYLSASGNFHHDDFFHNNVKKLRITVVRDYRMAAKAVIRAIAIVVLRCAKLQSLTIRHCFMDAKTNATTNYNVHHVIRAAELTRGNKLNLAVKHPRNMEELCELVQGSGSGIVGSETAVYRYLEDTDWRGYLMD